MMLLVFKDLEFDLEKMKLINMFYIIYDLVGLGLFFLDYKILFVVILNIINNF